jgi:hypothetical protein
MCDAVDVRTAIKEWGVCGVRDAPAGRVNAVNGAAVGAKRLASWKLPIQTDIDPLSFAV